MSNVKKGKNRNLMFAGSLVAAVIAAALIFATLMEIQKQNSYWVVNTQVPARTKVTPSMLQEEKVRGKAPTAAITAAQVSKGNLYTKTEINPGDILTKSNVGDLDNIRVGIPKDFSVASFTIPATNAAVGMAKRGDYIDIYLLDDSRGSVSLELQHVLVLDSVGSLNDVSERTSGPENKKESQEKNKKQVGKVATIYQVGLSRQDTEKLALMTTKNMYVALSPVDGANTTQPLPIDLTTLGTGDIGDSGKGTDPTFSKKKDSKEGGKGNANKQQGNEKKIQKHKTPDTQKHDKGENAMSTKKADKNDDTINATQSK